MKHIYFTTVILIVLVALFSILNKVWAGFSYFTLSFAAILCFVWSAEFIFRYYRDFKPQLEERFRLYKAEIINEKNLTLDSFNAKEEVYRKMFKRTLFKEYAIWLFKVLVMAFIGISIIVSMFLVA